MAITQATSLADFSTGIGTAGAILQVDNADQRIGIGTTDPQGTLQVGIAITMDGTAGVITASSFSGDVTGTASLASNLTGSTNISVGTITATGNVSVGGTLTYEDVTNIDAVGVITARTGVKVTAGGVDVTAGGLNVTAGISTFAAGGVDVTAGGVDVTAGGLNVTAGVSTFAADLSIADKIIHTGDTDTAIRFPSANIFTVETGGTERLRVDSDGIKVVGAAQITATQPQINFTAGGSAVAQAGQILVGENGGGGDLLLKTKTTGGTLTTRLTIGNDGTVNLPDNGKLTAGAGDDLQIYHDGSNSKIVDSGTGQLILQTNALRILNAAGSENMIDGDENGAVTLYHNSSTKLETSSSGVTVTGTLNATTAVTQNGTALATNGKAVAMALVFG